MPASRSGPGVRVRPYGANGSGHGRSPCCDMEVISPRNHRTRQCVTGSEPVVADEPISLNGASGGPRKPRAPAARRSTPRRSSRSRAARSPRPSRSANADSIASRRPRPTARSWRAARELPQAMRPMHDEQHVRQRARDAEHEQQTRLDTELLVRPQRAQRDAKRLPTAVVLHHRREPAPQIGHDGGEQRDARRVHSNRSRAPTRACRRDRGAVSRRSLRRARPSRCTAGTAR